MPVQEQTISVKRNRHFKNLEKKNLQLFFLFSGGFVLVLMTDRKSAMIWNHFGRTFRFQARKESSAQLSPADHETFLTLYCMYWCPFFALQP
jgi:hypothetical protein